MPITYSQTERGFGLAQITSDKTDSLLLLLEIQASSAINVGKLGSDAMGGPHDCLRWGDGKPFPGSSYLWLRIKGPTVSAHLNREEVSLLASVLTRWLATGFVQPEA